jgi:broad specificity phosphatase PhoE
MSERLPTVYLFRHGETAWSLTGQRTRLIDLLLTERSEHPAREFGEHLKVLAFANAS